MGEKGLYTKKSVRRCGVTARLFRDCLREKRHSGHCLAFIEAFSRCTRRDPRRVYRGV
jgi:hypothetical protein